MESMNALDILSSVSSLNDGSIENKPDGSGSIENKPDASDLTTQFNNLNQIINIFKTQLNDIQNQVKAIEKNVKKELKNSQQQQSKETKKSSASITIPIGFAKPTKVSAELCCFMNRPVGSAISRTDATQYILKYIRDHGLQEMDDRKKINPDETLSKLLGRGVSRGFRPPTTTMGFRPPTTTEDGEAGFERAEPFTYYNLQTYLNPHFI